MRIRQFHDGASATHQCVFQVAAPLVLICSTVGCFSPALSPIAYPPEIREQMRQEDLRGTQRKLAQQEEEAKAHPVPPPAPAQKPLDLPPKWRPLQLHLSVGPTFRRGERPGADATLSLAHIWSSPRETSEGGWLRGPFAGAGVEGTAGDDGVTIGPLLRLGAATGEYVYPGTNSADLYTYGQLVPFVGIRRGHFVSGVRIGGGATAPGFLREVLGRNHNTLYADDLSSPVDAGLVRGGLAAIRRLILVPLALVNHIDANVEATSERKLSAGVGVGSDPSELVPLR